MLSQFARVSIDMLLLRRGPQDMPSDWRLLVGLGVAYCSLAFAQMSLVAPAGPAIFQAVLATTLLAAYVNAVLRLRETPDRFVQTLSALFAIGSVLTLLILGPTSALAPFLHAMAENSDAQTAPQPPAIALFAYMLVGVWNLVVFGHIYRHALEVRLWMGIGAAVTFEVVFLVCMTLLGGG